MLVRSDPATPQPMKRPRPFIGSTGTVEEPSSPTHLEARSGEGLLLVEQHCEAGEASVGAGEAQQRVLVGRSPRSDGRDLVRAECRVVDELDGRVGRGVTELGLE